MDRIRFSSSFSKCFDRIGRRIIGLFEEGDFGDMLGFRMRMMVEYFRLRIIFRRVVYSDH